MGVCGYGGGGISVGVFGQTRGWTGRSRTFRTGYEAQRIYYVLQVDGDEGKSWVWVHIGCDDHQAVLEALSAYRSEIEVGLGEAVVEWVSSAEEGSSWVAVSNAGSFGEPEERPAEIRAWMLEGMVKLRSTLQPKLDIVMSEYETEDR